MHPTLLPELIFWNDTVERDGPSNMAVDEWLSETATTPVLRSYRWQPGWASFGYFDKVASLPADGHAWVRRSSGGGVVFHDRDWSYTVFIPKPLPSHQWESGGSYRWIHTALRSALASADIAAEIHRDQPQDDTLLCFDRITRWDLIRPDGRKLAGAGQRRTKHGILHQGSVATSHHLGAELAGHLSGKVTVATLSPPPDSIAAKVATRYANPAWHNRR